MRDLVRGILNFHSIGVIQCLEGLDSAEPTFRNRFFSSIVGEKGPRTYKIDPQNIE